MKFDPAKRKYEIQIREYQIPAAIIMNKWGAAKHGYIQIFPAKITRPALSDGDFKDDPRARIPGSAAPHRAAHDRQQ